MSLEDRKQRKPVDGFNVDVVPDDWFPRPPHGAHGDYFAQDDEGRPVLVQDRRMLVTQGFLRDHAPSVEQRIKELNFKSWGKR